MDSKDKLLKESIRKRILGPVHIHLDVTARFTKQIPTIYPIISTQSSIENYAKIDGACLYVNNL